MSTGLSWKHSKTGIQSWAEFSVELSNSTQLKSNQMQKHFHSRHSEKTPLLPKANMNYKKWNRWVLLAMWRRPQNGVKARCEWWRNLENLVFFFDLTKLFNLVFREKYILPSIEQTLQSLAVTKMFNKLDAKMDFWQIPSAKESANWKIFSRSGRFFFRKLPFLISSALEHYQNRMVIEVNEIFQGVICHILIWGHMQEKYDTYLHAVLRKLE